MLTLIHQFKINGRRFSEVHKKDKLTDLELNWLKEQSNGEIEYVCEKDGWQIFEVKKDKKYEPVKFAR